MKIIIQGIKQNRGFALIMTVILLAFAALYFVTYLVMTAQEYTTVTQSQNWNASLTVAEAGVEEGLAFVNENAYLTTGSISNWSSAASQNGWTNIANITAGSNTFNVYSLSRNLPNNSGSYAVYVTNVINSANPSGVPVILSIGTVINESGLPVSREILVKTSAVSISKAGGLIAQDGITMNGNVEVDSWDSSNPLHSIWQSNYLYRANYFSPGTEYGIWSNSLSYVSNSYPSRTAEVNVFTDTNAIDLTGNITVAGYLETGPGGTESVGSQSSVGDLAWCFGATGSGGSTGLEPGHWEEDANENFHSDGLPIPSNSWQASWLNIPSPTNVIRIGGMWTNTAGGGSCAGTWKYGGGRLYTNTGSGYSIGGTTYSMVITNRLQNTNSVYYSADLLSQNLFVDAQYVVLYLTNGWSYSGQDTFTLNTNADIQVWTTGDISASGKAVINNLGNYTHAFNVYDVPGNPITVSLNGNGAATGNYYLPSSTFSLGGGGNSGDFVGSIVCYQISDGGHVNIHFDQSLGTISTPDQYIPSTWTEVTPQ